MRPTLILLAALAIFATGCQLVPTDMFPKVKWYWSKDAIQYRHDRDAGNAYKHQ